MWRQEGRVWHLRWRDPPGRGIGDGEEGGPRLMLAVKRGWRRGGVEGEGRKLAEDRAARHVRRGGGFMMAVRVGRFDRRL